jgi:hypothetical protein
MNRFTESIRELVRLIKALSIDDYLKTRLGVLSLEHMRPAVEKLFERLDTTSEVANELDDKLAERVANVLRRIQKDFIDLANVSPERFPAERDSWLETMRTLLGQFTDLWPFIVAEKASSAQTPQADYNLILSRIRADLESTENAVKPLKEKLDKLGEAVQGIQSKKSAVATAYHFKRYFESQARRHSFTLSRTPIEGQAKKQLKYGGAQMWLIFSIASIIVLGCVLLFWTMNVSLTEPIRNLDSSGRLLSVGRMFNPGAIPELIGHVFFLSLLLFLVRFCFRQYSIHQHLYTVNIHKSNLAGTFYEILRSSVGEDAASRSIVTQETIRTLATFEGSGYVDSANPDMNSPIEIIAKGFVDTARSQTSKG